jgi:hypothetical protein
MLADLWESGLIEELNLGPKSPTSTLWGGSAAAAEGVADGDDSPELSYS